MGASADIWETSTSCNPSLHFVSVGVAWYAEGGRSYDKSWTNVLNSWVEENLPVPTRKWGIPPQCEGEEGYQTGVQGCIISKGIPS